MPNELEALLREKYPRRNFNSAKFRKDISKDIERLNSGEPLAYIIGWSPFLNCRIDLSCRPLIPRVETEYWTEKVIKELERRKTDRKESKCLDLFAGSGAIGIAVLKNIKKSKVSFGDRSEDALKQIGKNLKLNHLRGRSKIIRTNVFSGIKGKFDIILANPPYIPSKRKLPTSVSKFEPKEALLAGTDGMKLIKLFLKDVSKFLNPSGICWLEFDVTQVKKITALLKRYDLSGKFEKDQYGKYRFVRIMIK